MLDDTQLPLPDMPTREKWRDVVRQPGGVLKPTTRHVAVTMADYWPKAAGEDLWCTLATIMGHTGLSESSVLRAIKELKVGGFLVETQKRSQYRSPRYRPMIPEVQTRQADRSGPVTVKGPDLSERPVTLDVTPYVNLESASKQASTPLSAQDEGSASPASPPTPRIPNPRGWTDWRAEDRILWEQTLEDLDDYTPAELDEIYVHWCQRFDWPGKFAESMATDHRLDGFLGGSGIDLGLYDETDEEWEAAQPAAGPRAS